MGCSACLSTEGVADGYLNENGTINTKRLQVILDEMAEWEREVFEKEYADLNWYKGKQAKHVKEMELARKRSKLGTCTTPLPVFDLTDGRSNQC